jgi:hypothetical protein
LMERPFILDKRPHSVLPSWPLMKARESCRLHQGTRVLLSGARGRPSSLGFLTAGSLQPPTVID